MLHSSQKRLENVKEKDWPRRRPSRRPISKIDFAEDITVDSRRKPRSQICTIVDSRRKTSLGCSQKLVLLFFVKRISDMKINGKGVARLKKKIHFFSDFFDIYELSSLIGPPQTIFLPPPLM